MATDWTERRRRILISPRRLSQVARKTHSALKWAGTSHGYKMKIRIVTQLSLAGERMEWGIRPPGGQWIQGKAGTVFDCIQAMELAAAEASK